MREAELEGLTVRMRAAPVAVKEGEGGAAGIQAAVF